MVMWHELQYIDTTSRIQAVFNRLNQLRLSSLHAMLSYGLHCYIQVS